MGKDQNAWSFIGSEQPEKPITAMRRHGDSMNQHAINLEAFAYQGGNEQHDQEGEHDASIVITDKHGKPIEFDENGVWDAPEQEHCDHDHDHIRDEHPSVTGHKAL